MSDVRLSNDSDDAWIEALMWPRSIAVIGASENPEKIGGRPIKYMKQYGFGGKLFAVNPRRSDVQGVPTYPDVASLPETPDMAMICVPGQAAVDAVQACAERGVKIGVIVSSGFGETGPEGREKQEEMRKIASDHGMRLVGPNTQGLANFKTGAIASFATLIGEIEPRDGGVAVISQSGAMSALPFAFLSAEGIGVRYSHATGNEIDLTVADLVLAAVRDPEVKLVLAYMESVTNPDVLAAAAKVARSRGVPILVLKSGTSAMGQAAARSHTGALATENKLLDAYFEQNGILRVASMRSLVLSARIFLDADRALGNRVVAISNSGASSVMAADAAERHGLQLPRLSNETSARLTSLLPEFASGQNPIDLTAALLTNNSLFGDVLPVVTGSGEIDMVFVSLPMSGRGYDAAQFARDAASAKRDRGIPIVVSCPLEKTRKTFEEAGIATFAHDEDAMEALGQLARMTSICFEANRLQKSSTEAKRKIRRLAAGGMRTFLSEHESLGAIRELGIPVVDYILCTTAKEFGQALDKIPGPRVIKACSSMIPHKTEHGFVKLGVTDREFAFQIFDDFMARGKSLGLPLDGVIVAQMMPFEREMIVGARWDEDFGTVVVIGDGGKYVEAMPDSVVLLYPFDEEAAMRGMKRLRMAPLFEGVRGEQPLPLKAIATIASKIGAWVDRQNGHVLSVDINPLLLAKGEKFAAADALVELSANDQKDEEIKRYATNQEELA